MMKRFLNTVLFLSVIGIVAIISLFVKASDPDLPKQIKLKGADYLTEEQYISFAKIDSIQLHGNNLSNIRDRFQKHPYVRTANAMIKNESTIEIEIEEKIIVSLIINKNKKYFITDEREIIPILKRTKNIDIPVISNLNKRDLKIFKIVKDNQELNNALKLISGLKILSADMYKSLAEINFKNGQDIIIIFEQIESPVVITQSDLASKLIYLKSIWNLLMSNDYKNIVDYVDLRFDKHVYLGINNNISVKGT